MNVTPREFLPLRTISTERIRLFRIGESLRERLRPYFGIEPFPTIAVSPDMNRKSGNTESFNRLLVNWLALQNAVGSFRSRAAGQEATPLTPWNCEDPEVRRLLELVTRPENLQMPWQWLRQSASGETEIWAQQVLQECQLRSEKNKP